MQKIRFFITPFSVFSIILIIAAALSSIDYSWSNWKPASCMPAHCFCEAIRPGVIAQPANTWSSFGFVLVGLLVIRQSGEDVRRRRPNLMTSQRAYPLLFGMTLMMIGLGSAFYHASLTFAGQFFDVMGMYLAAVFILLYNFSRVSALSARRFVLLYVLLNLILASILLEWPALRRYIFAALVLFSLWPEYRVRTQKQREINGFFLHAAWWTLVAAFIIWVVDLTKFLCYPTSWLQGHALWHLLGATAAGFLYLYYRSELIISR
jgi:hypothetical protein